MRVYKKPEGIPYVLVAFAIIFWSVFSSVLMYVVMSLVLVKTGIAFKFVGVYHYTFDFVPFSISIAVAIYISNLLFRSNGYLKN